MHWGAKRIAHGHSAPFSLHYVEIGNEDATPRYAARFVKFYDAICAKYPSLKIIHNQLVQDLSSLARIPDVIDDHF